MEYVVEAVESGSVNVRFADGSWAKIPVQENMTEEQFDALVLMYAPKTHTPPSFIFEGQSRTAKSAQVVQQAQPDPELAAQQKEPEWLTSRKEAYGPISMQIEFITENGLQAWQDHVASIKNLFPKE